MQKTTKLSKKQVCKSINIMTIDLLFLQNHNTKGNRIGNGLNAELLRFHKSKVIYLGFTNNINDLITMDEDGGIAIWKYKE
jgi:hypothetical protein